MKSDHLVSLAQYEFRTLRKHMLSMYAELHFHENATTEFKREFCRKLVPRFFARIRNYRKVSLETIVLSELVRHSQKGNLSQKNVSISA